MKKLSSTIAALAFAGFALTGLQAQDKKVLDVKTAFKGKLIEVKDGEVVEAELTGDPEYYVLYFSASW